jgi:hypothetical protein
MDNLIKHYRGRITGQGHEMIVKKESDEIAIGFKHSGEYQDEYDPFVRVATIEHEGDVYRVGWFHDDAEEPSDGSEYTDEEDLFAALDQAIEQRSKEAGRSDG